jgi:ribosomal protein L25 (general stress protein Ctc)
MSNLRARGGKARQRIYGQNDGNVNAAMRYHRVQYADKEQEET